MIGAAEQKSNGKNYRRLQGLVCEGAVRIVYIEAVPRSLSTALGRSLNESTERCVFVNEPFNHMMLDMEAACGSILAAVDRYEGGPEQLMVVTKSMARNLTLGMFNDWVALCSGMVWSVRDPQIQFASLVTRLTNDLLFGVGADSVRQEDLTREQVRLVCDYLENGPVSERFSKTNWADMYAHFIHGHQLERSVVVDGGLYAAQPRTTLRAVCHGLDLPYHESMVTDWQHELINANNGYGSGLSALDNAWTKDAMQSRAVHQVSRAPLPDAYLPAAAKAFLAEVAVPAYDALLSHRTALTDSDSYSIL